jgi:hypothetical protein
MPSWKFLNYNRTASTPSIKLPNYNATTNNPLLELSDYYATSNMPSSRFPNDNITFANGLKKCRHIIVAHENVKNSGI